MCQTLCRLCEGKKGYEIGRRKRESGEDVPCGGIGREMRRHGEDEEADERQEGVKGDGRSWIEVNGKVSAFFCRRSKGTSLLDSAGLNPSD